MANEAIAATPIVDEVPRERSFLGGLWRFAKKKPLGAACGVVVLFFLIIGDLVPETLNQATSVAGAGRPVPYLVDVLEKNTSFVYPYSQQSLRERLQGPSSKH